MKQILLKLNGTAAVVLASALVSQLALAQAWPSKPVRFISPFPAGGGSDIVARLLAPKLGEALGQQNVVENRTGAAGNVGAEYVAKSAPDGYTFLLANNTIVINPSVTKTLFDVQKDFAPVALVASTPVVLAVNPSVIKANSVKEFIDLARAQPGVLSYSSCGNGTAMHHAGELLKQVAKIDMTHVPYRGCAPAITDGLGGTVPVLFNTITNTISHAKAGKLKIIGLASATRSPVDSSIGTMAEAGLTGFDADIWFGVMGPAGTPREIITRLNTELNKALQSPELRQKLADNLFDVRGSTPEQFATVIRDDLARWAKVVQDANIKAD